MSHERCLTKEASNGSLLEFMREGRKDWLDLGQTPIKHNFPWIGSNAMRTTQTGLV